MDKGRSYSGISSIIGAVMLLALVFLLLTTVQAFAVPTWNEELEFDHNKDVQDDVLDLGSAIQSVASIGSPRTVSVKLGKRYPNRLVFVNPSPASGTLYTTGGFMNISHAESRENETKDYWDGGRESFPTELIIYEPNYNYYQDAPDIVYDNSYVYNYFRERQNHNNSLSQQILVTGKKIYVVALNGSLSTSQVDSESYTIRPISSSSRTISLTNSSNERINLTMETELLPENWSDALGEEEHVHSVSSAGSGKVNVTLEGNVTYELRMAEVGLDRTGERDAHYITNVRGNKTNVSQGSSRNLVVEVRDKFNNPVSGVTVNASFITSEDPSEDIVPENTATGTMGRAKFEYQAPSGQKTAEMEMNISGSPNEMEKTKFVVYVEPP